MTTVDRQRLLIITHWSTWLSGDRKQSQMKQTNKATTIVKKIMSTVGSPHRV